MLKWLITGTGRCGTVFISKTLKRLGVACGHEQIFGPFAPHESRRRLHREMAVTHDLGWQAESSWLAMPFLDWPELDRVTIVHLVRHPKKVMEARIRTTLYTGFRSRFTDWAETYCVPEMANWSNSIDKTAVWYLRFNEKIEKYADISHRVEDPVTELLDAMGIDWHGKNWDVGRRVNHQDGIRPADVRLADISEPLRTEMAAMSKRYGYKWERESEGA